MRLSLGHARDSRMSLILPRHEEIIWKKSHRYFGNRLDGIYFLLKGLLETGLILRGTQERMGTMVEDK
jgi:hypothetical protein